MDAPPVVGDGVAYVAGDLRIEARDIETGERLWETESGGGGGTSPVLACGTVYVTRLDETLALDPADGTVLWRADIRGDSDGPGSPIIFDDTLYLGGNGVVALDAETGERRWAAGASHATHGVAVTDHVYVGAGNTDGGEVAALTRDGNGWWRRTEIDPVYTTPAVAGDTVCAVTKTGTLLALAAEDGRLRWQASVESGVFAPPAVADGRVIVGAGNGHRVMAFDATTGDRLWTFSTGISASQL